MIARFLLPVNILLKTFRTSARTFSSAVLFMIDFCSLLRLYSFGVAALSMTPPRATEFSLRTCWRAWKKAHKKEGNIRTVRADIARFLFAARCRQNLNCVSNNNRHRLTSDTLRQYNSLPNWKCFLRLCWWRNSNAASPLWLQTSRFQAHCNPRTPLCQWR